MDKYVGARDLIYRQVQNLLRNWNPSVLVLRIVDKDLNCWIYTCTDYAGYSLQID
jgi:hypothetical protein